MPDQRFPIGPFVPVEELSWVERRTKIAEIAAAPARLKRALVGLDEAQLDTPYRRGGWTVRQVVHHLPDSHMNAYIRLKLALTEDEPTIRPFDQTAWARLPDTELSGISVSIRLLEALHTRFTTLLRSLGDDDFRRRFRHPEAGIHSVDWLLALYSWHGRHHVAHITSLRERSGW